MSSPFFEDGWEEETQGALITARARAAAFIEATTDNRLKMQLKSVLDALIPCQDAIRLLSAFLLVSSWKYLCGMKQVKVEVGDRDKNLAWKQSQNCVKSKLSADKCF